MQYDPSIYIHAIYIFYLYQYCLMQQFPKGFGRRQRQTPLAIMRSYNLDYGRP